MLNLTPPKPLKDMTDKELTKFNRKIVYKLSWYISRIHSTRYASMSLTELRQITDSELVKDYLSLFDLYREIKMLRNKPAESFHDQLINQSIK